MKNLLIVLCMFISFLTGCSYEANVNKIATTESVEMYKYKEVVYDHRDLLSDWVIEVNASNVLDTKSINGEVISNSYLLLKESLLPSAIEFASSLNLSKDEIEEITGVEIMTQTELENAFVGVMLFATMVDCS